ncbi:cupredoxin domain-containing protein [Arthrobacter sp. H5]|uniref:cupredoxin domain-containing protein n=1 Tax=Arthrobacter sp. H5 TaxID=1267973 RepID=UPI0004835EEA|nr:cupredoxin domain-containing protein [Arthrobacter sp. H5]
MNIRNSALGIVLAASLIGVAGCGSGDSATEEVPEPEASSAAAEPTSEAPAEESPSEEAPAEEEMSEEPEAAAEVVITIVDFTYEMPESIPAGAEVTVTNEDTAPHTVTSEEEGLFDVNVPGGETVTFTAPEEAGEFAVICTFHANMSGTLVVTDG